MINRKIMFECVPSVVEVVQLGVRLSHAGHSFGDQLEVGAVLAANVDGLDAGFNAFLEGLL